MSGITNILGNKGAKIALTLAIAASGVACKNDSGRHGPLDPPLYIPPAEGGSGGTGGGGGAGGEALDCTNLDPSKIYIFGTLDGFNTYAIADVTDPTRYCVGFSNGLRFGVISEDGEVIYRGDNTEYTSLYTMVPDSLSKDEGETRWGYPLGAGDNDSLFLRDDDNQALASITNVRINRSTGDAFYDSRGSVKRGGEVYRASGTLVAALDDGSILIKDQGELLLVNPDLNETSITLPESYAEADIVTVESARLYTDASSGAQSVWLAMGYVDAANVYTLHRWSVDLSTLTAVDEGEFAPAPADADIDGSSPTAVALDGGGNLWVAYSNSVIIERPLSGTSRVVYSLDDPRNSDGSWMDTDTHFIYFSPSGAGFITGM